MQHTSLICIPLMTHEQTAHVVPWAVLAGVFVALLVLTYITVAVTSFDLGSLNLWIALGVATIKGALVVLYFMHLRYDSPFNSIVFVTALRVHVPVPGYRHHGLDPVPTGDTRGAAVCTVRQGIQVA